MSAGKAFAQLKGVSEWVSIAGTKLGCRGPDDDKLIETALMGETDCLISRKQLDTPVSFDYF